MVGRLEISISRYKDALLTDFFEPSHLEDVLRFLFYAMDASESKNCPDVVNDEGKHSQYIACILEGSSKMPPKMSALLNSIALIRRAPIYTI